MKKLFLMLMSMCILLSFVFSAEKIEIVNENTIIRSAVMAKDNVGVAKVGDTFTILDTEGAWHFVEITDGSKHIGKSGWVWRKLVKDGVIIGDPTLTNPGVVLHVNPSTGSEAICRVKAGATYKLIKKKVKWYKVAKGWLYYYNCKKLE